MDTSDAAFGFGKEVTGGGSGPVMLIGGRKDLAMALKSLGDANGPIVLELGAGDYDFSGRHRRGEQMFPIRARNLTIRPAAGARVVLQNIQLAFDLTRIDNILIENLSFHSDGAEDFARDAISLDAPGPNEPGGSDVPFDPFRGNDPQARVRITHCAFDGYHDISIDSHSRWGLPRLLATIDHCLFFDGQPGQGNFQDRGAINIDSAPATGDQRVRGSSYVTVARNAFINVWRRSPRVVEGNIAHIFNNVLYRWGAGNATDPTWVGMAIGGGTGESRQENGTAVIQANRFIPITGKESLDHTVEVGANAVVDLGLTTFPNRFDTVLGVERVDNELPRAPTHGFTPINIASYVGAEPLGVESKETVSWKSIVKEAGPEGSVHPATTDLLALIDPPSTR